MDQSIDIVIGASSSGVGPEVREVVGLVSQLSTATRETADSLERMVREMRDAMNGSGSNASEREMEELRRETREAAQEMERLQREMRETDRAANGLGDGLSSLKRGAVGLLAGIGVVEVGRQIVTTASQFESLRGVLQTLEPAQGVAAARFEDLRKLAATTPFALQEVVTAFSRLKAMGLDPSSAAITSYGNTASAMGKSLDQMIEAVADAATGEFERLKEFGIKARQQGEEVTFTFQGVSTTVGKNSQEIQEYLLNIGDVNFAGAMERQSATFGGMMSNLADNVANVADQIGQGGLMDALKGIVTDMNEAGGSSENLAGILGGVLGVVIETIWGMVLVLGQVISDVFATIANVIREVTGSTASDGEIWKTVILGVQQVIVFFGASVQEMTTLVGGLISGLVQTFVSAARAIEAAMRFDFSASIDAVRNWGTQITEIGTDTARKMEAIGKIYSARALTMTLGGGDKAGGGVDLPGYEPPKPSPAPARAGGGAGGGGGGGAGESRVQKWAEELQRMQVVSEEFLRDNTQQEADFWQAKLALTSKGSDDWFDVQERVYQASKRLAQQAYQEQIAQLDFQIQSAQGEYVLQQSIEAEKVELIRRTFGEKSSQYRNALREQERMVRQHEEELTRIQQQGIQRRQQMEQEAAQTDLELQRMALGQVSDALQYHEEAGLVGRRAAAAERARIAQAEFQAQMEYEDRIYQLRVQSLRDQLALDNLRPQETMRINAALEEEVAGHEQRMRIRSAQQAQMMQQASTTAANATRQVWMDRLAPVTQAMTSMVNGFLQGTMSVRQAMLQMGSQILQQLNGWIMQWVQQHVASQQAATAATVAGTTARTAANTAAATTQAGTTAATATAEITTNAAVSASGALASISKIPVIGPFIAPAIAAGILALAMGFIGKIASAEGGWGQVPYDGAMTELHKDEMVLPASIASPLRDALAGKDSNWSLGSTGLAARQVPEEMMQQRETQEYRREGDTHFHLSALDTRTGVEWLSRNRRAVGKALGRAYREGSRE